MVKLIARSPAEGLLPLSGPGVDVIEVQPVALTSLADLGGLTGALKGAHGLDLPEKGRVTTSGDLRCAWFAAAHYLLIGAPFAQLTGAAVTDQSDAWCHVRVSGPRAAEALSYLTPIDLRDAAFPPGRAARTLVGHMNALILRDAQGFEIFVFRSMAATLVHELEEAFKSLP